MRCARARSLLMAYLDSELDARTTVEIGEHLAACASCRTRFDQEARLEHGLAAMLRQETMPDEVWDSIRRRVLETAPAPSVTRRWRPLALAASLMLAVGLGWLAWPRSGGILDDLIVAHEQLMVSRPPLAVAGPDTLAAQAHLASHSLGGWTLPEPGRVDGHELELLGVRNDVVRGLPVATLVYRCCGELVSVFVMRYEQFELLPEAARLGLVPGEVRPFARHGIQATGRVSPALFLSVVSGHATPLHRMVET